MPRHTPAAMTPVVRQHRRRVHATAASASEQRARRGDLARRIAGHAQRHERRHQHQPGAVRGGHQEGPERDAGVAGRRAHRACAARRRAASDRPPRRRAAHRPGPAPACGPSTGPTRPRRPRARPTRRARSRSAAARAAPAPRRAHARPRRRRTSSRSPGSIHAGRRGRRLPATATGLPWRMHPGARERQPCASQHEPPPASQPVAGA